MWVHIDTSSGVPIYVQLIEQVKKAVAGGLLNPGEQLPSVRELALELTVNPNTIAKAYQELEREGIIQTLRGRGTFVSQNGSKLGAEARKEALQKALQTLFVEVHHLQIPKDELINGFNKQLNKWFKE